MTYKICEYCGKEFEASRPNQIYCSKECGKRNWNERGYVKIKASRDWGLVAYLIPRQALEDTRTKFTEPELLHNSIYFLVGNQDGDSLHRFRGKQVCFPLALKVHRKSMVFS